MAASATCRNCAVLVVLLSTILVYVVFETDLGGLVSELPRPSPSGYLLGAIRPAQQVSPVRCTCSMTKWPGTTWVHEILNQTLPWLNTTAHQEVRRHSNLPDLLFHGGKKRCSLLPTFFSIEWYNTVWQRAALSDTDVFFLYSAFYDPEREGHASLRVLGVSRSPYPTPAWCQVWLRSDAPPLAVRVTSVDYLDYQGRSHTRQMPYLLRCPLPPHVQAVPLAVSLVQQPCGQATNLLKVTGARQRQESAYRTRTLPADPTTLRAGWAAAVCGPALFYYHEDFSLRLVEWLEVLRAQGFSRVFLYATDVHPNISKVLHHYTREGFVQVTDYTYPPPYVNDASLRRLWVQVERVKMFAQENVYFTDCVLRHMHQYRFLAHFDPDELPILHQHHNFTHLLDELTASTEEKAPLGYKLQFSYFFSNLESDKAAALLPHYLWALRHTGRQGQHFATPRPGQFKPVYDMNSVRGVFSHGPLVCVSGDCRHTGMKVLPTDTAFLGHFKRDCDPKCKDDVVTDLTLLKYKDQVGERVLHVLKALDLV